MLGADTGDVPAGQGKLRQETGRVQLSLESAGARGGWDLCLWSQAYSGLWLLGFDPNAVHCDPSLEKAL